MSTKDDIVIKIGAKAEDFQRELNKTRAATKQLQSNLRQTGQVAGVAFAAGVGSIGLLINAHRRQEQAQLRTIQTIKATGGAAGISADEIFKMASALQSVTDYGDEAIIEGQNLLLTFKNIGKDVFPQTTEIMLDMSKAMGTDLKQSSIQLGKALNDPLLGISALSRVGVTFTEQQKSQIRAFQEMGDIASAQKVILKELQGEFGGTARAAAQGTGAYVQAGNSLGDIAEIVGKELSPAFQRVAVFIRNVADRLKENEALAKYAAYVVALGTGVAGLTAGLALGAVAFLNIRNAMIAANISTNILSLSMKKLLVGSGIGLFLVLGTEAFLNWEKYAPKIDALFKALSTSISDVASGLGKIISGLFSFDVGKIKEGVEESKKALVNGFNDSVKAINAESNKPENKVTVKSSIDIDQGPGKSSSPKDNKSKIAIQKKLNEVKELKAIRDGAAQEEVELLKRKNQLLVQEEEAKLIKDKELRDAERERINLEREQLQLDEEEFRLKKDEQELAYKEIKAGLNEQEKALLKELRASEVEEALSHAKTLKDIEKEALKKKLQDQAKANTQFIKDQKEFGKAYALINQTMNTDVYRGTRNSLGQLAALQNSSNKTLKSIGKKSAKAMIIIRGAEAAVNIYRGFSSIPIIGHALGVAGAIASLAYTKEQVTRVQGAQKGTRVQGLGLGLGDKYPFMLEEGEFVTPRHDADYHIDSVAERKARKIVDQQNGDIASGSEGSNVSEVIIRFRDDALDILEAEIFKRNRLGTGAILS